MRGEAEGGEGGEEPETEAFEDYVDALVEKYGGPESEGEDEHAPESTANEDEGAGQEAPGPAGEEAAEEDPNADFEARADDLAEKYEPPEESSPSVEGGEESSEEKSEGTGDARAEQEEFKEEPTADETASPDLSDEDESETAGHKETAEQANTEPASEEQQAGEPPPELECETNSQHSAEPEGQEGGEEPGDDFGAYADSLAEKYGSAEEGAESGESHEDSGEEARAEVVEVEGAEESAQSAESSGLNPVERNGETDDDESFRPEQQRFGQESDSEPVSDEGSNESLEGDSDRTADADSGLARPENGAGANDEVNDGREEASEKGTQVEAERSETSLTEVQPIHSRDIQSETLEEQHAVEPKGTPAVDETREGVTPEAEHDPNDSGHVIPQEESAYPLEREWAGAVNIQEPGERREVPEPLNDPQTSENREPDLPARDPEESAEPYPKVNDRDVDGNPARNSAEPVTTLPSEQEGGDDTDQLRLGRETEAEHAFVPNRPEQSEAERTTHEVGYPANERDIMTVVEDDSNRPEAVVVAISGPQGGEDPPAESGAERKQLLADENRIQATVEPAISKQAEDTLESIRPGNPEIAREVAPDLQAAAVLGPSEKPPSEVPGTEKVAPPTPGIEGVSSRDRVEPAEQPLAVIQSKAYGYQIPGREPDVRFDIRSESLQQKVGVEMEDGKVYEIHGRIGEVCEFTKTHLEKEGNHVIIIVPREYRDEVHSGQRYDVRIDSIEERRVFRAESYDGRTVLSFQPSTLESLGFRRQDANDETRAILEFQFSNLSRPGDCPVTVFTQLEPHDNGARLSITKLGVKSGDEFEVLGIRERTLPSFVKEFNASAKPDALRNVLLDHDKDTLSLDVEGHKFPFTNHNLSTRNLELVLRTHLELSRREFKIRYDGQEYKPRLDDCKVLGFKASDYGLKMIYEASQHRISTISSELYIDQKEKQPAQNVTVKEITNKLSIISRPEGATGDYLFQTEFQLHEYVQSKLAGLEGKAYMKARGAIGEDLCPAVLSLGGWREVSRHPLDTSLARENPSKRGPDSLQLFQPENALYLYELKWWKEVEKARVVATEQISDPQVRLIAPKEIRGGLIGVLDWEMGSSRGVLHVEEAWRRN